MLKICNVGWRRGQGELYRNYCGEPLDMEVGGKVLKTFFKLIFLEKEHFKFLNIY